MTTENFTYWLQGFFEISDVKTLNEKQVQIIKDHLDLVFDKVTPDRNKQEVINKLPGDFTINSELLPGLLDDSEEFPKLCNSIDEKSTLFCTQVQNDTTSNLKVKPLGNSGSSGGRRVYC